MTETTNNADSWSGLHDLAFIYVVFSKVTDKVLKNEEADEIISSLREWVPDISEDQAQAVFMQALKLYQSKENWHPYFLQSLENVKEILSESHIFGIIGDLVRIAKSDERIYENEKRLIGEVACILIGDMSEEILQEVS